MLTNLISVWYNVFYLFIKISGHDLTYGCTPFKWKTINCSLKQLIVMSHLYYSNFWYGLCLKILQDNCKRNNKRYCPTKIVSNLTLKLAHAYEQG